MKLIVAGSRSLARFDWSFIEKYGGFKERVLCVAENRRRVIEGIDRLHDSMLKKGHPITEIIEGGAIGPDTWSRQWAEETGVSFREFQPDWKKYGRNSAGFRRNEEMAEAGDALLAVWDGISRGTDHMISAMRRRGKPVITARWQSEWGPRPEFVKTRRLFLFYQASDDYYLECVGDEVDAYGPSFADEGRDVTFEKEHELKFLGVSK